MPAQPIRVESRAPTTPTSVTNTCSSSSRCRSHIEVSAPDMAPQRAMPTFIWLTHPQSINPQCRPPALAPEPGIVDVGVPMAQCDVVGIGSQLACNKVLARRDPRRLRAQAGQELRRSNIGGQQPGVGFGEFGQLSQPSVQGVRVQWCAVAHRRGLHVQWKIGDQVGRQAPGSVRAGQASDGGEQRAIVLQRLGHLVVEALVILTFDSIAAKGISSVINIPVPVCAGSRRTVPWVSRWGTRAPATATRTALRAPSASFRGHESGCRNRGRT